MLQFDGGRHEQRLSVTALNSISALQSAQLWRRVPHLWGSQYHRILNRAAMPRITRKTRETRSDFALEKMIDIEAVHVGTSSPGPVAMHIHTMSTSTCARR